MKHAAEERTGNENHVHVAVDAPLRAPVRTELAHRSSDGIDVTLVWVRGQGADKTVVLVCDRRNGSYFEIPAETYLALDVYYHPFVYRDFSTVDRLLRNGRSIEQKGVAYDWRE